MDIRFESVFISMKVWFLPESCCCRLAKMTHIFALQFVQPHIVPSHYRFHEYNSGSPCIPFRAIKRILFSFCLFTLQVPSKAL